MSKEDMQMSEPLSSKYLIFQVLLFLVVCWVLFVCLFFVITFVKHLLMQDLSSCFKSACLKKPLNALVMPAAPALCTLLRRTHLYGRLHDDAGALGLPLTDHVGAQTGGVTARHCLQHSTVAHPKLLPAAGRYLKSN